jgi:hypothetical protein
VTEHPAQHAGRLRFLKLHATPVWPTLGDEAPEFSARPDQTADRAPACV